MGSEVDRRCLGNIALKMRHRRYVSGTRHFLRKSSKPTTSPPCLIPRGVSITSQLHGVPHVMVERSSSSDAYSRG